MNLAEIGIGADGDDVRDDSSRHQRVLSSKRYRPASGKPHAVAAAFLVRRPSDRKAWRSASISSRPPFSFAATVHDLAEAELCYAPQFGAAKDPVNLAGMLAENVLNGDMPVADWLELDRTDALLLDVREPDEFAGGHIRDAINLPLSQLRDRYAELPTNREIWTYCGVGQRAYFTTRFLAQHGYRSRNLSGGYATYQTFKPAA